jgi:PiT family inorganic phosphate transporter
MAEGLVLLITVVVLALAFDYINGFHDTANAIATVVSTNVLSPRSAVLMAGFGNVVGAFLGTGVAQTISSDIADPGSSTETVIVAALVGAIIWNLITWRLGIPSSSSHAIVGGLCGAVVAHHLVLGTPGAFSVFRSKGVVTVFEGLFLSPVAGLLGGLFLMILLSWLVRRMTPVKVNKGFRVLQLASSCFMAISHGTNDAQKSMGIVTMALVSYNGLHPGQFSLSLDKEGHANIPLWVVVACALAMGLGTSAGGWRIMKTMGHKIIKLKPIHGFAAETAGALVIQVASALKAPVSTTHVISSAIMGVGAAKRVSAVRWGIAGNILMAWVLTIPITCIVSGLIYLALRPLLGA